MSTFFNNANGMGSYHAAAYGYAGSTYVRPLTVSTASSTMSIVASTIYLFPFSFDEVVTPSSVAIRCGTLSASSSIRLVIYAVKGDGMPSTLVADLGTVSTASTGEKTIAYTTPLYGQYWIGLISSAHTPALSTITLQTFFGQQTLGTTTISGTGNIYGVTQASVSSYFTSAPADLSSDTWTAITAAATSPAIAVIV